jgi:hypothetical protein
MFLRVTKLLDFHTKSFVFVWYIPFKATDSEEQSNFISYGMFSWAVIFSVYIIELNRRSCYVPQKVIIFVCSVTFIFVVTKVQKSQCMKSHLIFSIKGCKKLH